MKNIISSKLFQQASRFLKIGDASDAPVLTHPIKPKIGLALSSGGARGLAHIGVLEVLEENGISVDVISGSSMGAYVGAHYARGVSIDKMIEIAEFMKDKNNLWKIADPMIPPVKGFMKGDKATDFLRQTIGNPQFNELEKPLYIISFDLDTQEKLVINQGNVATAVHASCAIPGVISPVMWNGHRCSDGGVVDPIPVHVLQEREQVDMTIAVSLLPSLADIAEGRMCKSANDDPESYHGKVMKSFNRNTNVFAKGNTVDTLRRSVRAAQAQIAHQSCEAADIVVRPEVFNLSWHSFSSLDDILEAGRAATRAQIPAIKKQLALLSGEGLPEEPFTNPKPIKAA